MLVGSDNDLNLLRTWGEAIGGFRVTPAGALEPRPFPDRLKSVQNLRDAAKSARAGGTSVASLLRRYFGMDASSQR